MTVAKMVGGVSEARANDRACALDKAVSRSGSSRTRAQEGCSQGGEDVR